MAQGYIKSLDGVRAIAIILVMTFHAGLNHFGWTGVQLFFVLSGYLITGILWKEKFREEAMGYKFKRFWVRRSLRIFPLYFGFLAFLGITYLLVNFPSYYTTYIPYLATYTVNYTRTMAEWGVSPLFTHLWSLSIEEQFYLFFPMIVFFVPARALKFFMLALILLAPLIRYLEGMYYTAESHPSDVVADAIYWNTLSHLDAFFMGGIIPVLSLDKKLQKPDRILILFFLVALLAGIANFVSSGSGPYVDHLGYKEKETGNYEYVWHYTVLNLFFASLLLYLTSGFRKRKLLLDRLLEWNWLVRIGRVSYGMYIFHWAIWFYFFARFITPNNTIVKLLLFLPYLVAVYLFSELSYRLYEVRFLKLKDKLFR